MLILKVLSQNSLGSLSEVTSWIVEKGLPCQLPLVSGRPMGTCLGLLRISQPGCSSAPEAVS